MFRAVRVPFKPFSLALVVFVAGLVSGCSRKPKVGDSCKKGMSRCLDKKTRLICDDGKYIASPCRGANGCKAEGQATQCDLSGNRDGDACSTSESDGLGACTADGKTMLTCERGAYRAMPCGGTNGCTIKGSNLSCDTSVAAEGDRCRGEGGACSGDGKRSLACEGGKFVAKQSCRGAQGCQVVENRISCDLTVGDVGDACTPPSGACSSDGKKLLRCGSDGKLAVGRVCRGGEGCAVDGRKVGCADPTVAEAGDPCTGDGAACAVDHKHVLQCKNGQFVVGRSCKCSVQDSRIKCG